MAAGWPVALAAAALLGACGAAQSPETAKTNVAYPDQSSEPAPVTDPAAPTVAVLQRRGLQQVDDEPAAGPDCGPNCVMDAYSAIYLGPPQVRGQPPDRRFICPVAHGDMATWRCRAVPETARWGGAGPPPQPNGRQKALARH